MSDITLTLDLGPLEKLVDDLTTLEPQLQTMAASLAAQTHLHIIQTASTKLHTTRQKYLDALTKPEEISKGVYVITLEQAALWLEEGMPEYFMGDTLLKPGSQGVKTAKDGSLYRVIPFTNNGAPSTKSDAGKSLIDTLKSEFKTRGIPWTKMETGSDGKPKQGLVHKFDINKPDRPAGTEGKPGWGKGPVGSPLQGKTGIPWLQGVRVYQNPLFDAAGKAKLDKSGSQRFGKSVMTFRVISSKHKSTGQWHHPGIKALHALDDAMIWAEQEWDTKILPEFCKTLGID